MSFDDFCKMTIEEISEVIKAWHDARDAEQRDSWERMRMHAAITIQPHCRKKITPQQLLKFKWDNPIKKKIQANTPKLTKEESKARFIKRLKQEGYGG